MTLSEIDKLRLQALLAKRDAAQAGVNYLYWQFVANNSKARELNDQLQLVTRQQDELVKELFDKAKLKMGQFTIDPEKGVFVPTGPVDVEELKKQINAAP